MHWIVPTIAGSLLATSLQLIFVAYLNYLVDSYLMFAASAIAANTIARSAAGSSAPLFTNQMFKALGVGGGGSLIGGVAAVLAIIPFMFYKYGKAIRIRSKFAPARAKKEMKQPDEERHPITGMEQEPEARGSASSSTVNPAPEEGSRHTAEMATHTSRGTDFLDQTEEVKEEEA